MRKLILALALAGTALSSSAVAAEKLKIGTEGAYPPFNFVDSAARSAVSTWKSVSRSASA